MDGFMMMALLSYSSPYQAFLGHPWIESIHGHVPGPRQGVK